MKIHDVFHTSLLKPYKHDPLRTDGEMPPLIIDGQEEFEVEALIGRRSKVTGTKKAKHSPNGRKKTTRWEYLVSWKGYGPEHNEYVPETELLRHCKQMIKNYDKQHPIAFVDRLTKMVHLVPTIEKLTTRGFAEMLMANII
jgi:hypothetical protein